MADLTLVDGVIDLETSLDRAMERELEEEVRLTSKVISTKPLKHKICSSATEVDEVHMGIVYMHELDGEGIHSAEDQLENVGFVSPSELLNDDYNLETWAQIVCRILLEED